MTFRVHVTVEEFDPFEDQFMLRSPGSHQTSVMVRQSVSDGDGAKDDLRLRIAYRPLSFDEAVVKIDLLDGPLSALEAGFEQIFAYGHFFYSYPMDGPEETRRDELTFVRKGSEGDDD